MALLLSFLMALLFLSIFPAGPALAQNWAEVGDAGPLPGSSQNTAGGAISSISGTLTSDADIDMYCIRVVDHVAFSACLLCLMNLGPDLYLFDSAGKGVATVEICQSGCKQITGVLVPSNGVYYLAVAPSGASAKAGANQIWANGLTTQRAPDGPGAASAITVWGGTPVLNGPGAYTVNLAGVNACALVTPSAAGTWGRLRTLYR